MARAAQNLSILCVVSFFYCQRRGFSQERPRLALSCFFLLPVWGFLGRSVPIMGGHSNSYSSFDHSVLNVLKPLGLQGHSLVVAVSGGMDSMSLLTCLFRLRKSLDCKIFVAHIHHGRAAEKAQQSYRDQAWEFVRQFCQNKNIPFFSNREYLPVADSVAPTEEAVEVLTSEAERRAAVSAGSEPSGEATEILSSEEILRDYRYECLAKILKQVEEREGQPAHLVLAHHADDLLETQLIRLIRGTGSRGLAAMSLFSSPSSPSSPSSLSSSSSPSLLSLSLRKLRPLLGVRRQKIKAYAQEQNLQWVDDPSNHSEAPDSSLRVWIRNHWLPQLEEKRPGAGLSLSRSLHHLSAETQDLTGVVDRGQISRTLFNTLTLEQKKRALAQFMWEHGLKNYGLGHIKEILKQLSSCQRESTFSLLGCHWRVTQQKIELRFSPSGDRVTVENTPIKEREKGS